MHLQWSFSLQPFNIEDNIEESCFWETLTGDTFVGNISFAFVKSSIFKRHYQYVHIVTETQFLPGIGGQNFANEKFSESFVRHNVLYRIPFFFVK